MAISVADNFSYQGGKPLDARMKFSSVSDMVSTPAASLYDGCFAYVTATKKYYSYDSSNETDQTLGKWVEYSSGGDVDPMPAEDMAEVIDPLPSVMSRLPRYSTQEQIVGYWIDGKPLYQRVYDLGSNITLDDNSWRVISEIDTTNMFIIFGYGNRDDGIYYPICVSPLGSNNKLEIRRTSDNPMIRYITIRYTKSTDTAS